MKAADRKIATGLSLLMTGSVAVNLVAFQGKHQAPADAPASARTNWVDSLAATPVTATATKPMAGPGTGPYGPADSGSVDPVETTRAVQRELNTRGYEAGQPDGVAGVVTRAAIFAYEFDSGLVLSGRPSETLLSQILLGSSSLAQTTTRQNRAMTPDGESFAKSVKLQLANLGYPSSAQSGPALTPEFARAIHKFEADQKLKDSGRISAPMMSRILHLQVEAKTKRPASKAQAR